MKINLFILLVFFMSACSQNYDIKENNDLVYDSINEQNLGEEIVNSDSKELECEDSCLSTKAINQNNITICLNIESEQKDYCLNYFLNNKTDILTPDICTTLKEENIDICLSKLDQNEIVCNLYNDFKIKDQCKLKLALKNEDYLLCNDIEDLDIKFNCYETLYLKDSCIDVDIKSEEKYFISSFACQDGLCEKDSCMNHNLLEKKCSKYPSGIIPHEIIECDFGCNLGKCYEGIQQEEFKISVEYIGEYQNVYSYDIKLIDGSKPISLNDIYLSLILGEEEIDLSLDGDLLSKENTFFYDYDLSSNSDRVQTHHFELKYSQDKFKTTIKIHPEIVFSELSSSILKFDYRGKNYYFYQENFTKYLKLIEIREEDIPTYNQEQKFEENDLSSKREKSKLCYNSLESGSLSLFDKHCDDDLISCNIHQKSCINNTKKFIISCSSAYYDFEDKSYTFEENCN